MIKSSFKKIEKPTSSQKIIFGHPEFDAIFNNSFTKGHLMVIEEDHPTTNYLSLLRYFISNNYNEGIASIIFDGTPAKWKKLISPAIKKELKKEENGEKHEIAWRYDKMQIKMNELALNEQINFIDLSKQIVNPSEKLIQASEYPHQSLTDFYQNLEQALLNAQQSEKDTSAKKLLLASLPAYYYNNTKFSQLLHALKCLTRSSHLFTVITVPAIISEAIRGKLIKFADYYLQIGKIAKGYEDFSGTLTIIKQYESCQIRNHFRGPSIWGIKSKKKEIRLESLYEQPFEDEVSEKTKKESNNDF